LKLYRSLEDLATDDAKWRQLAFNITLDKELADEILHNFYSNIITLIDNKAKVDKDFEINSNYVITALKNSFRTHTKKNSQRISYNDNFNLIDDEDGYDYVQDCINQCLTDEILNDASQLEWFDKKLFQIIVYEKKISMRKLARQSGISYNTIQKSVVKTKLYLKNKQELKNGKVQ